MGGGGRCLFFIDWITDFFNCIDNFKNLFVCQCVCGGGGGGQGVLFGCLFFVCLFVSVCFVSRFVFVLLLLLFSARIELAATDRLVFAKLFH